MIRKYMLSRSSFRHQAWRRSMQVGSESVDGDRELVIFGPKAGVLEAAAATVQGLPTPVDPCGAANSCRDQGGLDEAEWAEIASALADSPGTQLPRHLGRRRSCNWTVLTPGNSGYRSAAVMDRFPNQRRRLHKVQLFWQA